MAEPVLAAPALLQLQVYDLLRKRIVACAPGYEPGAQLNMTQLAAELKISITPVKDAVRRLQADGLVETKPRQGVYVSTLSNEDLEHLVAVRRGLEILAADLFVPPVDPAIVAGMEAELEAWLEERRRGDVQAAYAHHIAFHQLAVAACGNRFVQRLYEQLHAHVSIAFAYYTRSFNQTDDEVLRHRLLLDALVRGDQAEVRLRVAEHYRYGRPILGPEGEIPLAPQDAGTATPNSHAREHRKKKGG